MIDRVDRTNYGYRDGDIYRVFTYGMLTLDPDRRQFNFRNEELTTLEGYRKFGFKSLPQCFYIMKREGYRVIGASYDATPELLKQLDEYEDKAYSRKPVLLTRADGLSEIAWAYIATNLERVGYLNAGRQ